MMCPEHVHVKIPYGHTVSCPDHKMRSWKSHVNLTLNTEIVSVRLSQCYRI
jgi:hypothetical protein